MSEKQNFTQIHAWKRIYYDMNNGYYPEEITFENNKVNIASQIGESENHEKTPLQGLNLQSLLPLLQSKNLADALPALFGNNPAVQSVLDMVKKAPNNVSETKTLNFPRGIEEK